MRRTVWLLVIFLAFPLIGYPAAGPDVQKLNLDGFYAQWDGYLQSHHSSAATIALRDLRGPFSLRPGDQPGVYAESDIVYILFTLGELDQRTTPAGRKEIAGYIQSCQNRRTGWFTVNWEAGISTSIAKEHGTAYAVAALTMLGEKPLYPLTRARQIGHSRQSLERYLSSNLWAYVWAGSHQGGGLAAALAMTGEAPPGFFDWWFGWLEKTVNPATGLWQRGPQNLFSTRPRLYEMGGAPHFWWVYAHQGRPLPYPEKIIDSCLSLQLSSGFWDPKGYTYCVDLDALWSIHRASLQLRAQGNDYRAADIRRCFERYLAAACRVLNRPDSLTTTYRNTHTLAGALIAVAEAQKFFRETMREERLLTPVPLRQPLDVAPWI